jgi:Protein of unknown function (DUF559)
VASIISMRMPGVTLGATDRFAGEGFQVLRFWNNEIDRNLEGVLTQIDAALGNPPPGLPPIKSGGGHPPPQAGEGWS